MRGFGALLVATAVACSPGPDPRPVPDPDLAPFQAPVAERLRSARADVLEHPADGGAWGRFGEVLFAHHLIEASVRCFATAHELDPETFRWPYLASIAMIDVDTEAMVSMLESAHRLRPDYVPAAIRLGRALLSRSLPDEAREAFRSVLDADPENPHALLGLGRCALDTGDPEGARVWLERARGVEPRHREVHVLLARTYRALGLDDAAREAAEHGARSAAETPLEDEVLETVMALGSSAVHLAAKGRDLLRGGDVAGAIEVLREAHRARPDYFDVRIDLGAALILAGETEEGALMLREAEREAPDELDAESMIEELRRAGGDL